MDAIIRREQSTGGISGQLNALEQRLEKAEAALRVRLETVVANAKVRKGEISLLKTRVNGLEAASVEGDVSRRLSDAAVLALGADATADATLYTLGRRQDVEVFKELYHFSPTEIEQIDGRQDVLSIFVINQRATLVAKPATMVTPAVESAFQTFVKALQAEWGNTVDLTNKESKITQAYWQFRESYDSAEQNGDFNIR
ncbi:hypothetical protein MMC30_009413 [Trapelia coarctata]|nr:hypothetical protein [Trapelia coarctata]